MWYTTLVALLVLPGWSADHPAMSRAVAATTQTTSAPSDAPPLRTSLQRLERGLVAVQAGDAPDVGTERDRALAATRALLDLSTAWPAASPLVYRRSLHTLATVFDVAVRQAPAALPQVLRSLGDDLEDKLEHCRASGGRLGGAVTVHVRTVQGGGEVRRWQVLYMPKILEVASNATPDLFPQLSSPTNDRLVPGRYLIWARQPFTGRTSERQVLKVGEGRSALEVELPVPPGPP